jgi:hypothetical protein
MRNHSRKLIGLVACLLSLSAVLIAQSGRLDAGDARELLRHLWGGELPKAQVRVKSVEPGLTGNDAIVEAQIETAYRFARSSEGWKAAEIRIGDRQWESIELMTEAIRREKIRRTTMLMQQLAEALEAHKRTQGSYVVADEFVKLLDQLPPRYASLRNDLWGAAFSYRGTASAYQLVSAGPDRQMGTGDDLVMENGALRAMAQ